VKWIGAHKITIGKMDTIIKYRKFKFVHIKTQFEKAKYQFTTDVRFLHGFEKFILGWMFIDLPVH